MESLASLPDYSHPAYKTGRPLILSRHPAW